MAATHFDDIHEFLAVVDLRDIVVHEERARRIVWDGDPSESEVPAQTVSLGVNIAGNAVHFRFKMVLADENAEYVADVDSVYVADELEEVALSADLQQEFARRVAFMASYPFLRASIFGSASRLGTPRPVLGLARQGDYEPGEALTAEEARATFFDNRSDLDRP